MARIVQPVPHGYHTPDVPSSIEQADRGTVISALAPWSENPASVMRSATSFLMSASGRS